MAYLQTKQAAYPQKLSARNQVGNSRVNRQNNKIKTPSHIQDKFEYYLQPDIVKTEGRTQNILNGYKSYNGSFEFEPRDNNQKLRISQQKKRQIIKDVSASKKKFVDLFQRKQLVNDFIQCKKKEYSIANNVNKVNKVNKVIKFEPNSQIYKQIANASKTQTLFYNPNSHRKYKQQISNGKIGGQEILSARSKMAQNQYKNQLNIPGNKNYPNKQTQKTKNVMDQNAQLKHTLEQRQKQLQLLDAKNKTKVNEWSQLISVLQQKQLQVKKLQVEVEFSYRKISELTTNVGQIQKENAQLRDKVQKMRKELDNQQQNMQKSNSNNRNLQILVKQLQQRIKTLSSQQISNQIKQENHQQIKQQHYQHQDQTNRFNQQKIKELQSKSKQLQQVTKELQQKSKELNQKDQKIENMRLQAQESDRKIEEVKNFIHTMGAQMQQKINNYNMVNEQLKMANQRIKDIQQKYNVLILQNSNLKSNVQELSKINYEKQSQLVETTKLLQQARAASPQLYQQKQVNEQQHNQQQDQQKSPEERVEQSDPNFLNIKSKSQVHGEIELDLQRRCQQLDQRQKKVQQKQEQLNTFQQQMQTELQKMKQKQSFLRHKIEEIEHMHMGTPSKSNSCISGHQHQQSEFNSQQERQISLQLKQIRETAAIIQVEVKLHEIKRQFLQQIQNLNERQTLISELVRYKLQQLSKQNNSKDQSTILQFNKLNEINNVLVEDINEEARHIQGYQLDGDNEGEGQQSEEEANEAQPIEEEASQG